eukprot:363625-Chlamydomonas_euryale.AAC.21
MQNAMRRMLRGVPWSAAVNCAAPSCPWHDTGIAADAVAWSKVGLGAGLGPRRVGTAHRQCPEMCCEGRTKCRAHAATLPLSPLCSRRRATREMSDVACELQRTSAACSTCGGSGGGGVGIGGGEQLSASTWDTNAAVRAVAALSALSAADDAAARAEPSLEVASGSTRRWDDEIRRAVALVCCPDCQRRCSRFVMVPCAAPARAPPASPLHAIEQPLTCTSLGVAN